MKLLLDQNLPRSLLSHLTGTFPGSAHVLSLGLDTASDVDIFVYAKEGGFTILSKDNDFRQLSFVHGSPPKVVWLRVGNCTVQELTDITRAHVRRIAAFDAEPESLLIIEPQS